MDIHEVVQLVNAMTNRGVEDRLYFIQANGEHQSTTANTVSSVDPLRPISEVVDVLRVCPTRPTASDSVEIQAGSFYCRGRLYYFPGCRTSAIVPHPTLDTKILVGLKIDPDMNTVEAYVAYAYETMPALPPNLLPLAVIDRVGTDPIVSDFICDVRPFLNFDVTGPKDKVEYAIDSLAPQESVVIDRGPFHSGVPIYQLLHRLPGSDTIDSVTTSYTSATEVKSLYRPELVQVTDAGTSLKSKAIQYDVSIPNTTNGIYVSPWGVDANDGLYASPVASIAAAIDIANNTQRDTVYFYKGEYPQGPDVLVVSKPIKIVGESPTETILLPSNNKFIEAMEPIKLYSICIKSYATDLPSGTGLLSGVGGIELTNCLVLSCRDIPTSAPILGPGSYKIWNCVFHNLPGTIPAAFAAHLGSTGSVVLSEFRNNILYGKWMDYELDGYNSFSNIEPTVDPMFVGTYDYHLRPGSPALDTGDITRGLDLDGTWTDVGLYGGPYAVGSVTESYQTDMPVVVTKASPFLLGAEVQEIEGLGMVADIPDNTSILWAFRLEGRGWFTWNQETGSWISVPVNAIATRGIPLSQLSDRLAHFGITSVQGPIEFAAALRTQSPLSTPILKELTVNFKPKNYRLQKVDEAGLDVRHVDRYTVITNRGSTRRENLVFVAI